MSVGEVSDELFKMKAMRNIACNMYFIFLFVIVLINLNAIVHLLKCDV